MSRRLHLLYPCDPLDPRAPDAEFAEELSAVSAAGFTYSLVDLVALGSGATRLRLPIATTNRVLYRGWMLEQAQYQRLYDTVAANGGAPVTWPANYARCHRLPGWYEQCAEFTPPTLCVDRNADFSKAVEGLDWPAYFVKDHVKSFSGPRGSVARTPGEIAEIVDLIERYRGGIEGGVCIRRFEPLQTGSEERYFVAAGHAYARDGHVPELVKIIASRIDNPFFAVDVALDPEGNHRLIEIGDGQVSDRKQWPLPSFVELIGNV